MRPHVDVDPEAGFRVDLRSDVLTITLDRPERLNSQRPMMWTELTRVRRELPGTVRVAVLRAEGRAFSAGLDRALIAGASGDALGALAQLPPEAIAARIAVWQEAFDWTSRAALVSVAAVQGHAIGGGFQLALGADIRIVADDVQFCMAEPSLGIVPDLGGTKRLVDLVGYSRAAEICLTGRRVGAEEAAAIGLASRVVARADLDTAIEQTVADLLAVKRDTAIEVKALLQRAQTHSQAEQQAAEREAQARLLPGLYD